ncbi:MAG TPA: polysaccharide biosynthesis tyrosine autokinase [Kiritimatiellia bacterium]|nr:polysaccharide biosynthesis tyrosine autokinase [Kiritimatiellia bacterium]
MSTDPQTDNKLHFLDYWRVIKSRKEIILAVVLLVVLTGMAYTLTMPKIYMANARISVREDALDVPVFERQYMASYNPFFLRTQFEIIQSRPILHQVIQNLDLMQRWAAKYGAEGGVLRREDAYLILSKAVRVNQYRDTSLIDIQVFSENREEAARIANEIANVYRDQRLSLKRRELQRGVDALENELQKQQDRVNIAENELERIRREGGVSILQRGYRVDKVRLQSLEADRISSRVDMLVREARLNQLEALSGEELLNASAYIVNDQSLLVLRRQVVDAEVQLKLLLENFGVNHPEVRRVQAGLDELRIKLDNALEGLKKGIRADFEVARAKYHALETELEEARAADIQTEAEQYLPFERSQRNVEIQREILTALRARVAQQGIELGVPRTPVEVIEPAEVPSENRFVSPRIMFNIVLSALLGIIAGIGLAFFIEYLDTSVKTVEDVERHLGLPVLGVIPQKVRSLMEEGPDSAHAEAYRVLRTNMQFARKTGGPGGAFAVVSGGAGEGKSTTLFNLAYVCAQLGDKVLVVDSDLRRPVQHTFLGISNRFGLTNVLLREVPVEEAIKASSLPNLHFLPSGKLPRTSLGLLDSQRMRELVKSLKARYDVVFFDSPPIVGVSDASILASEVDGVLLVVQYRKYPRDISARARRMLDNVGAKVLGVVLNNINILRDDNYYYYHSYYSHYDQSPESTPAAEVASTAKSSKDSL